MGALLLLVACCPDDMLENGSELSSCSQPSSELHSLLFKSLFTFPDFHPLHSLVFLDPQPLFLLVLLRWLLPPVVPAKVFSLVLGCDLLHPSCSNTEWNNPCVFHKWLQNSAGVFLVDLWWLPRVLCDTTCCVEAIRV